MRLALGVFAITLFLLFLLEGSRVVLTNDEGIILEAAQRMARGERLYVDFFGYMSPGGYWLQTLAFRLLGVTLPAARAVVFTDFALQAAVLAWLVDRFATRRAALVAVLIFAGLTVPQPGLLTAQHRWDSAALAILSAALVTGEWCALAGACAALAAICTPSVATVFGVTALWFAYRRQWRALSRYALGGLATGLAAILLLVASGSLSGFLLQMRWLREHYSAVNVMPYGSIIGGWGALLTGQGAELLIGLLLLLGLALPAILPVVVVPWSWSRREFVYLSLVVLALVASAFPRADVMHLAFFAALPLALATLLLHQTALTAPPPRAVWTSRLAGLSATALAVVAMLYGAGYVAARAQERPIRSALGTLRAAPHSGAALGELFARVRPGAGLYVHPYLPLFYFLTQAQNPTPYSYLAPGMMARAEEQQTLASLERHPPQWVLFLPLSRDEFLRVFPNATGLDDRFATIEAWIARHYAASGLSVGGYQLLERRQTESPPPRSVRGCPGGVCDSTYSVAGKDPDR